jgi:putative endonuclease
MFTTYILYSASLDRFYIGYTSLHIHTRLQMHLSDHKGFTAKAKDWKVVHTEQFASKADAMQREKQIKGWKSNIRIKDLIKRSSTQ